MSFLKWVGGKTELLNPILKNIPKQIIDNYYGNIANYSVLQDKKNVSINLS